jgi:hypothetical protein
MRLIEDFFPKDIANVIWQYLPESRFKDRHQLANSPLRWNKDVKLKDDEVIFKPFSVIPVSESELTVLNINLEAYVYSNLDGTRSSIYLSELNGRYISPQRQTVSASLWPSETITEPITTPNVLSHSTRQTLFKCQSTPALLARMPRKKQFISKTVSLGLEKADSIDNFVISDLIKSGSLKTGTNEIITVTDKKVQVSAPKESRDISFETVDEELNFQRIVPPELSPHCFNGEIFSNNGQDLDLSLLECGDNNYLNYRNIGVHAASSCRQKETARQLAPSRAQTSVTNLRQMANLINDFEDRIMEAVVTGISAPDNQCRSCKDLERVQNDTKCTSLTPSLNLSRENENLQQQCLRSQGKEEEQETRMILLLRPENLSQTKEILDTEVQRELHSKLSNSKSELVAETDRLSPRNICAMNLIPPDLDLTYSAVSAESAPGTPH